MYYIFKNELKRKLKNPVLWILILIMIILLYINIERSYEANEFDNILNYDPAIIFLDEQTYVDSGREQMYGKDYLDYINSSNSGISPSLYEVMVDNYKMYREAYYNNDFKEKNRINSFNSLLYVNRYANLNTPSGDYYLSKYICEIANDELWDKVSGGVKYEDIDFIENIYFNKVGELKRDPSLYTIDRITYLTISEIFYARYYYYLSNNNLDYIESDAYIEFNNLYVLNNWIKNIVPIIVIVVVILLNYDLINKDVKEGSAKLLITQSVPRWKYYLGKFFAGIVIALFVITVPLTISNIFLKTQVKSESMDYPIVYDEQGFTRFKPSFNYMEENFEKYEKYEQVAFYKIPYSKIDSQVNFKVPLYQRNTDLIAFNKFLLLTFFYTLLFIMFLVAFVQLCSAIINNIYLGLFTTTAIYSGFYFIFKPFLYGKHYNLCPFTMNNSARIVAGTHNVTMLTAFLVLTLSTVGLLFAGVKIFKKKNI